MPRNVARTKESNRTTTPSIPNTTVKITKTPQPKRQRQQNQLLRRPYTRHSAKIGEHQFYRNLDTFSLFPQLPIELRLQIWREILPKPRIVSRAERGFLRGPITQPAQPWINDSSVRCGYLKRTITGNKRDPVSQWERNPLYVPAIAQTCRESRAVFLKHYMCFSGEWDGQVGDHKGLVYMNMTNDVLDCGIHSFWTGIFAPEVSTTIEKHRLVKNLAFDIDAFRAHRHGLHWLLELLHDTFPAVENVIIYTLDYDNMPDIQRRLYWVPDPDMLRRVESLLQALLADWKGPRKQKPKFTPVSLELEKILDEYKDCEELDPVPDDATIFRFMPLEDLRKEMGMSELGPEVYIGL